MSAPMLIRDPAAAVAAGRCLNARVYDPGRWLTTDHPSRCGWCVYPQDELARMIAGFHEWSGWSERNHTYGHHELRVWAEIKAADQRAQVLAAQELEDEPPPAPGHLAAIAKAAAAAPVPPVVRDPEPVAVAPAIPPRPDWAGGRSA